MGLTKLDNYDYTLLPGVIRINIDSTNDPDLVDILSEIAGSNGDIYVEGKYYVYLDSYEIHQSYIDLKVRDKH